MSDDDDGPRTFWIMKTESYTRRTHWAVKEQSGDRPPAQTPTGKYIHTEWIRVIEYSAYETACRERDDARIETMMLITKQSSRRRR